MVQIPMVGCLGIAKAISTAPPVPAESASMAPTAEQCTSWIPRVIRPRSGISLAELTGMNRNTGLWLWTSRVVCTALPSSAVT